MISKRRVLLPTNDFPGVMIDVECADEDDVLRLAIEKAIKDNKNLFGLHIFNAENENDIKIKLSFTDFSYSNLPFSYFRNINLKGTKFRGANIFQSSFINCNLECVDFTGSNLDRVTFHESYFDDFGRMRHEKSFISISSLSMRGYGIIAFYTDKGCLIHYNGDYVDYYTFKRRAFSDYHDKERKKFVSALMFVEEYADIYRYDL